MIKTVIIFIGICSIRVREGFEGCIQEGFLVSRKRVWPFFRSFYLIFIKLFSIIILIFRFHIFISKFYFCNRYKFFRSKDF